eukprot:scaffold442_cov268-Pinguiococcus_pyrenoidosus.AAC.52
MHLLPTCFSPGASYTLRSRRHHIVQSTAAAAAATGTCVAFSWRKTRLQTSARVLLLLNDRRFKGSAQSSAAIRITGARWTTCASLQAQWRNVADVVSERAGGKLDRSEETVVPWSSSPTWVEQARSRLSPQRLSIALAKMSTRRIEPGETALRRRLRRFGPVWLANSCASCIAFKREARSRP